MNVEILVDGPYAKFTPGAKQTAQQLKAGAVVEFPDEYAKDLIKSKLAKETTAKVPTATKPGAEVIFEQDLSDTRSLSEQMAAANAERYSKEEVAGKDVGKLLRGKRG